MTAYTLQDDAHDTGELDYINGGNDIDLAQCMCITPSRLSVCLSVLTSSLLTHAVAVDDDRTTNATAALIRYSIAGNFLGLPAITLKVGYDRGGLPIGLQFIGRPWSEATLLHVAFATQQACAKGYKKPAVFYDLLSKQQE